MTTNGKQSRHFNLDAIQAQIWKMKEPDEAERDSFQMVEDGPFYRLKLMGDQRDTDLIAIDAEDDAQALLREEGLTDLKVLVAYKASMRTQIHLLFYDPIPDSVLQDLTFKQLEGMIALAQERKQLRAEAELAARSPVE